MTLIPYIFVVYDGCCRFDRDYASCRIHDVWVSSSGILLDDPARLIPQLLVIHPSIGHLAIFLLRTYPLRFWRADWIDHPGLLPLNETLLA